MRSGRLAAYPFKKLMVLFLHCFNILTEVQVDFNAACDRVSHFGLLFKFRDVGVGGVTFNVNAVF